MNDPAARRRKITLADVAAGCGVSRATVSLVLRRSPLVNAATRARVEAEFQRLGYVYNRSAASLRSRRSSSVALVINDLSNPFFAEFAAGVDEALAAAGYVTLLGSTGESAERQQAVLASLMEHDPAGVILSPAEGSDARRVYQAVGAHTPVLVFNRELAASGWDHLGLDNRDGARQATEHLLALGHTRIAFFGGHAGSSSCRQRREGYAAALGAAGLAVQPQWLVESAARRQKWVDQSQSLNIYMAGASGKKLDETYKLAWLRGLKTTYYLRTLGATSAEKSTARAGQLNAVPAGGGMANVVAEAQPKFCAIDDPTCEACQ